MQNVSTCLWFDTQALAAAEFYTGIFPHSAIIEISHYPEGALQPAGAVMTVRFQLDGTEFLALNGGPRFPLSPAVSLVAYGATQAEVDRLWSALGAGGRENHCGWLTDRFGVSWQVVPRGLDTLLGAPDRAAAQRAFAAMLGMTRLDIAAIQRAFDGA